MAANLQSRGLVSLGKRVVNKVSYASAPISRRGVQTSVYDKNPEEHVRDSVVGDEVIQEELGNKYYWGPHPHTGVFGPAASSSSDTAAGGERGFRSEESVLEQKAFFRPLEDLDKPPHP